MKKILIAFFCLFASFSYAQKGKVRGPAFDIRDFNEKLQTAEWLVTYDMVAWRSSDSVLTQSQEERNRLGPDWFCFQDESEIWHAIYGKFQDDEFDLVFHYFINENGQAQRTHEPVDTSILHPYSRALQLARSQFAGVRDSFSINFNQYIRQNDDKTFSVWVFPAFQPNGTAVFGGEFTYLIDGEGFRVLKDESYFRGGFMGAKPDPEAEVWLDYGDVEKPTVGAVFFVCYYQPYFEKIYIDCSKSLSALIDTGDGYTWVHAEKQMGKKKKKKK
jgi:hypothetical protein